MNEQYKDKGESNILFSEAVKAGKRIYYVDVKRDRNDELYLSITESKRVKDGSETERPVFEKHKIFLYHEDFSKFIEALQTAAAYAEEHAPAPRPRRQPSADYYSEGQASEPAGEQGDAGYGTSRQILDDFRLDIDF